MEIDALVRLRAILTNVSVGLDKLNGDQLPACQFFQIILDNIADLGYNEFKE